MVRYSNCLLAAVGAWLRDPAHTRIHFMRIRRIHVHWFWECRGEFWHFTTPNKRLAFRKADGETVYRYEASEVRMGPLRTLWFKGEERPFPERTLKRLRGLGRLPEISVTSALGE